MGTENLSRRTLAKGAAWSVPVIAASAVAPAYAASRTIVGGTVCDLFYAAGASTNYQGHELQLGVTSNDGTVPAGTVITWTVGMSGGSAMEVPSTNYSRNDLWELSLSPAPGTQTSSFTVTLRVNQTMAVDQLNCTPKLIWTSVYSIEGGTTVNISSTTTGDNIAGGTPSSLSYRVAERHPTGVNQSGRTAHVYLSKSGGQTCYPAIRYVLDSASQAYTCAASGVINSTSTIYPDGSCARILATSTQVGSQANIAQKC